MSEENSTTESVDSLANDKLRGVVPIAQYIGEKPRRTYYLLERRLIPAGKEGDSWIASKSRLRAHYARLASGEAA
jgi:hypothetical protein